MQITRHESWRLEYRANRYLRELTVEELLARAGDFLTNLAVHAPDGKISLKSVDLDGDSCGTQRFTHVLEEMTIRGISYRDSAVFRSMKPPKPKSPKVMRALKTLAGRTWPSDILVKFSKRRYMGELLQAGRGRLSPASSYNDESIGYARADNESSISAYLDPADAHRFAAVSHEGNRSVGHDVDVPYLGSVQIQAQANTDFYVYCLAEAADARLFDDFDADTCVVITNPNEFKARLQNAVSTQLPDWKFIDGPVMYFDPFFCPVHQMVPHFWKHFRFSYQREYRLVWLPPMPSMQAATKGLEHVLFDVGPLTDCARLIWL